MARSLAKPVRIVWALCLAIGACTHIAGLIKHGWSCGGDIPLASVIFWNSLTILDPLAAALLFLKSRIGVLATIAIMVSDVAHNWWVVAAFGGIVWMVVADSAFLIFVLATAQR
jgi:hypothetical protein